MGEPQDPGALRADRVEHRQHVVDAVLERRRAGDPIREAVPRMSIRMTRANEDSDSAHRATTGSAVQLSSVGVESQLVTYSRSSGASPMTSYAMYRSPLVTYRIRSTQPSINPGAPPVCHPRRSDRRGYAVGADRYRAPMDARRCGWAATTDPEMLAYHDRGMGRALSHDDRNHLFEMLTLEGAQAGLSWSTILRKREGYRRAFAGIRRRPRGAVRRKEGRAATHATRGSSGTG
ncbi:MAG: DNA-3-methyladenine glycosylase I [Actinomycetota bacterium]